jgi:hypothetical protein
MHTNGHTTVWGTQIGVGRVRDAKGWYQQLREWWVARKVAREQARLAALSACWDAKREAVRVVHAEAALDMIAPTHAFSATTAFGDLSV